MELFFEELKNKIQQAVKDDFKRILMEVGEEKIYSIALVTDSDCTSLFLAVNTYEYMRKQDDNSIEEAKDCLPKEIVEKMKAGLLCISKWVPADWGYSDGKKSKLNKVSEMLYHKEESLGPDDAVKSKYQELVLETIISTFHMLIQSDAFGEISKEITFFVSMSDDERTEDIENYSAKLLNSEEVYEEFLKRYEGWE